MSKGDFDLSKWRFFCKKKNLNDVFLNYEE